MLCNEAYAIAIAHDLHHGLSWVKIRMGLIARDQGDTAQAIALLRSSIIWNRDKIGAWGPVWNVLALATVATMRQQHKHAARLYGALDGWCQKFATVRKPHDQRQFGSYINATRAQMGEAAYIVEFEAGKAMTTEQTFQYALANVS